ncbi:hypothetical protein DFH29DRAFT_73041 [Suillus ampliporus]|nr:hypothetical protein DFH29DRAFT_73041 [Suillus ampliporus]
MSSWIRPIIFVDLLLGMSLYDTLCSITPFHSISWYNGSLDQWFSLRAPYSIHCSLYSFYATFVVLEIVETLQNGGTRLQIVTIDFDTELDSPPPQELYRNSLECFSPCNVTPLELLELRHIPFRISDGNFSSIDSKPLLSVSFHHSSIIINKSVKLPCQVPPAHH